MLTRQVVKLWRSYPRILKNCENRDKSCVRNQTINLLKRNYSSDVVVIGGGAMGASVAYWLKDKTVGSKKDLRVVVIEKDPTVPTPKSRQLFLIVSFAVLLLFDFSVSRWNPPAIFRPRKHSNVTLRCQFYQKYQIQIWTGS
jgi:hypothetical protein